MLNAILIDDEESNNSSLQSKLKRYCPGIHIIALCENAADGIIAIETLQPDIVFLDIEMPVMNGFVMLQQLSNKNFSLIFVTAYDHYAIKAIRFSALDYLVKPVEIEDLVAAVNRATEKKAGMQMPEQMEMLLEHVSTPKKNYKRLAIPSGDGIHFIKTEDIIYLEANINYTHIHLTGKKKYTMSRTLKDVEEVLDPLVFIRVHNSYIINRNFVEKYIRGEGGQVVMADGATLTVSKRKKVIFLKLMSEQ
jgi:two-component system LytT family response regulator